MPYHMCNIIYKMQSRNIYHCRKMARVHVFSLASYFVYFIMLSIIFFTSKSTEFSLKLIPLFSPGSPMYPGHLTQSERITKMVEISKARVNYLASMSSPDAFIKPENIHLRVHESHNLYTVEVFLGTPMKSQFLLLDTGSFLIWTQCLPCVNCFHQTTPIFNPNASSTYQRISCNDPLCRQPFRCENGQCVYRRTYAGGASSGGLASRETFTFPHNKNFTSFPGMVFGCANENKKLAFQGNISGILGLSTAQFSLIGQLKNFIQGRFSYCLVYGYREMEATSIMRFGEDSYIQSRDVQTTPILRQRISNNFYLNLLDISVGDHRIGFGPGTFALQRNGTGGCMIDTGAAYTFLDRGPYEIVMRHFHEHFDSFGCQRIRNASGEWEYCYRYNPRFRAYSSMTFHFQGADFKVEPAYMYFFFQNEGYFCIALSCYEGTNFLGAWQQQDTRFLYNLDTWALSFAPENCANDRL